MAHKRRPKLVASPFKDDQFRLSKNIRKRRMQQMRNVALVVAILIASFFAINYFKSSRVTKAPSQERVEQGSFEDILRNGTAIQLTNTENELESKIQGKKLPIVIDSLKKRLKVTNRMLELTDQPEVVTDATVRKLRVLSQWDFLNVMNEFHDPLIRDQLQKLAKASLTHEDEKVKFTASLVQQMTASYDYAVAPEGKSFETIAESFSNTAEALSSNPQLARNMLRICGLLNAKNLIPESNQLLQILEKNFTASDNETVQELGRQAKKIYLAQAMDLRQIADALDVDKPAALAKIHSAFDLMLAKDVCDVAEIDSMNRLIAVLLSRNLHEEALKELPRMATKVAALEVDTGEVKEVYHSLMTQASSVGKRIDLSGLRDEDGNPYQPRANEKNIKLLYFWSPDDEKTIQSLMSLHRNSGAIQNISVTPMAIFVDDGSSHHSESEFQQQVKELPKIDFYRVDLNTAEGKAFHKNCPITRLPYILLLDNRDRLQIVNPAIKRLRSDCETISRKTTPVE